MNVVCRRQIGINAAPMLLGLLGLVVVLGNTDRLAVAAGGAVMFWSLREIWKVRETVTFTRERIQRVIPDKGRFTWWLDGKTVLLYHEGISEPGRWGLPMQHEGLMLVSPGRIGLAPDKIPRDCDLLKLIRGVLTNEPAWAGFLLACIAEGRLAADPGAVPYLERIVAAGR